MKQNIYTSINESECCRPNLPTPLQKDNYLNEFWSDIDILKVKENLHIIDPVWGNITGNLKDQVDLMDIIKDLQKSINKLTERIQALENEMVYKD